MRTLLGLLASTTLSVLVSATTAVAADPPVAAPSATELRSAPHGVAPVVTTLPAGEAISVTDAPEQGWRFVRTQGGLAGYVRAEQLQAGAIPAAVLPPRLAHRFVFRPEAHLTARGSSDIVSINGTVGYHVRERLALETTLGYAGRGTYSGFGETFGRDETWTGLSVMAAARYAALLSPSGRHALTVAAGPRALVGSGGTAASVRAELAYEYHGDALTLLVGLGPSTFLAGTGPFANERAGQMLLDLHYGVGFTF